MDRAKVIDTHLETASLILLLVSADVLASDYCYEKERQRALERHDVDAAHVVPIIVRSCDWSNAPFGRLQALPRDEKPIKAWSDQEEAFEDIVNGMRLLLEDLQKIQVIVPRASLPYVCDIPYPRNPVFTGQKVVFIPGGVPRHEGLLPSSSF